MSGVAVYLLLLAIQAFSAVYYIWSSLPSFRQLLFNPGVQVQYSPYDRNVFVVALVLMQAAYWSACYTCLFRFMAQSCC